MDIPRKPVKSKRRYVFAGLAVGALAFTTVGLARLKPAAPSVDKAAVWDDVVERGTMVIQVRGPGTLVPEQIRWVAALTAGRVERRLVLPGTEVDSGTVLLEMSNPDVQLQLLDAERQLSSAEAQLASLHTNLHSQRLSLEASVATVKTQYADAKRNLELQEELFKEELGSAAELQRSREQMQELEERLRAEEEQLKLSTESIEAQLATQRDQVERIKRIVAFQRGRVASMRVVAGVDGVVQDIPLEEGQWVNPGETLARVVQPGRLKAVLRIPETQARDVVIGQKALIDTRSDTIAGQVVRIDPAAQNGTVGVDVALRGELPRSARVDLTVDGVIEIERLEDVLHVGRPAFGQANSMVGLFKVVENGDAAIRVNVRLGRSSVQTIQILDGLEEGDTVILSDMSAWDSVDRVRLK